MRRVRRQALQGLYDYSFDANIVDCPGGARTRLVVQAVHPALDKTPTPLADRRSIHAQVGRYILVLAAFRAGQHDPRPKRERLSRLAPRRQAPQFQLFFIAQH
jgi:hypothetical protein